MEGGVVRGHKMIVKLLLMTLTISSSLDLLMANPTVLISSTTDASLIEGTQNIVLVTKKSEIIKNAIHLRDEIAKKLTNITMTNNTITEQEIKEKYTPFIRHSLLSATMKIHEINNIDNMIHLLTTNWNQNTHVFQIIAYIQADEAKSNISIPYSQIKRDEIIMEYISKMKNTKTAAAESYDLEIILLGETLKQVLNTDSDILPLFCSKNTQFLTYQRITSQFKRPNETLEFLQDKITEVKKNFIQRVETFYPELTEAPQVLSRQKRNLWGSLWGSLLSLPTTDEVDKIRSNQDILLLNERSINQKFSHFDQTASLISKELKIAEDNFIKIKDNESQMRLFMQREEAESVSMRKVLLQATHLTHSSLDVINELFI